MEKKFKKNKLPKIKSLKKQCDELWALCVKERAKWRCELSGVPAKISDITGKKIGLDAHHIVGKPNYRLRYELLNGICLDSFKKHINGVHSHDPVFSFETQQQIIKYVGKKNWEWLKLLRNSVGVTDLALIKIYLKNELEKIRKINEKKGKCLQN